FFFSSRRRHTRFSRDWSSDVCSSDLVLDDWKSFLYKHKNPNNEVIIGLVGKYVELKDAYKSIVEAFIHAGASLQCKVKLKWIHSDRKSVVVGKECRSCRALYHLKTIC